MLQDYEATRRTAIEHAIKVYGVPEERIQVFQAICRHASQSWVEVENVPLELRQYRGDDRDWVCMICGKLVPTF